MVKFIFYASRPELFNLEIIQMKFLLAMYSTESEVISDWPSFFSLIPRLHKENAVVLLFVSSNEELEIFVKERKYFGSIPTIVVLPDDKTETLQKGMMLQPVYFLTNSAEPNQFAFAVESLCQIYENHINYN